MSEFNGVILTTLGLNLLAKAQTGAPLDFTRIAVGDGNWPVETEPEELTELLNEKMTIPIQGHTVVGDGTSELRIILTNTGLETGFFIREIGIFATDPDLGEILYSVTSAGDYGDFLPAEGGTMVEEVINLLTVIGNSPNVTAQISDLVVIATKQDIDLAVLRQTKTNLNILHREITRHFNAVQSAS
ncbi:MAG: phage tail protein [Magnetococcales bacterium]|nr:phage tail protein [Magnetococcales bacterium]